MITLFIIIFFAYRCLSLDTQLRVLQLNHYQLNRTLTHVCNSIVLTQKKVLCALLHAPFVCLYFADQTQLNLFTLLCIVYFYIVYKSNQALNKKVNVVYTKRMIRLYVFLFLFYTVFLLMATTSDYFLLLVLLLMISNPVVVLIAACIMHLIEQQIRYFYIRLAKKKLMENHQLIKVGVVGSYGKTSTKNIVYELLSEQYYCLKSKKSYNNVMGNTLMIRNDLKRVHEVMISEMGSDHTGEIKKLMEFIKPGYVILTSIGNQHMETFKTQENIVREKTSPLLYLRRNDFAIINIDNEYLYEHKQMGVCEKVYFGEHEEAHYRLCDVHLYEWGSTFSIMFQAEKYEFQTELLGYYNIMNICGSIALAHTLKVSFEQIQNALVHLKPVEHRLQSIQKKHYTLIDNAYNSNVKSFQNSMEVLSRIHKYRILITPGLIDLKEDEKINNELMDSVKGNVEEVVIVGYKNRMALCEGLKRNHFEQYKIMDTMEEALAYVDGLNRLDFVVLIENDIDKDYMNLQR